MTRSLRTLTTTALMSAALLSPLAACAQSAPGFDTSKPVATPSASLEFTNINPAIRMATAYGERGAGAHGSFGKFPANFITPMHTHTGAYHGVVVAGTMTNPFDGEANPPAMDAGSYWYVPAGAKHATACISAVPCEFYFHADSGFDFHPAE